MGRGKDERARAKEDAWRKDGDAARSERRGGHHDARQVCHNSPHLLPGGVMWPLSLPLFTSHTSTPPNAHVIQPTLPPPVSPRQPARPSTHTSQREPTPRIYH
ncbi:hypothetical protein Pcinc_024524 [Petrolisthes cinctipes]|uniref:Uncharacterized protein n=1 Tax=Petrolisthes cinctipes TaxID=88211 RepID=A0AAE1FB74_PETCI|nr:hypothetical protein Pcinc_024524 [Petrolisthes cinctipes]